MTSLGPSEKEIENSILDMLSMLPDIFAWKNHTTGIFDPKKEKFRALRGHALRGVSDILGIRSPTGIFLAFEVKTEKGLREWLKFNSPGFNPTKSQYRSWRRARDQKQFIEQINENGGIAGVVTCQEDVLSLLND